MELIDRIKVVMKVNNLSAAQLADEIGVQRSNVSHLLSGRNKPGFDFLNRLLERYPNVNAHWLITGKSQVTAPHPDQQTSTDAPPVVQKPAEPIPLERESKVKAEVDLNSPEVERIVLFYRNGTFREYFPGNRKED